MKKTLLGPPVEKLSQELRNIYYCVGKTPLHKLVPSGYLGSPGYTSYGTFTREDEGKHLSVKLGVRFDPVREYWYCFIHIIDGDDLFFSYVRDFTLEEWMKAIELYDSLYIIDSELLSEFQS